MYYSGRPNHPRLWDEPNCRILLYAESQDGIHWTKPDLGLYEWRGTRKHNIILPNDDFSYVISEAEGAWVFIDPMAESNDERYKMLIKLTPVRDKQGKTVREPSLYKGQYAFASPDGIRWRLMSSKNINPMSSDTKFSVEWDPNVAQYVAYTRVKHLASGDDPRMNHITRFYRDQYGLLVNFRGRLVGRMTSSRFKRDWSQETVVLAQDEMDSAGTANRFALWPSLSRPPEDEKDHDTAKTGRPRMQIYGGNVSRYSEAPGVYIAMLNMYYHWKNTTLHLAGQDRSNVRFPGTVGVQLATSRDGINWHRSPGRRPLIRHGPAGSWWSGQLWPAGNQIRVGDQLWIYFVGIAAAHNLQQDVEPSNSDYGRAILRLDGFISADAAYTGGELITRPMLFEGSRLQLNVDAGNGGLVQVEILDEAGDPIEGVTLAEADEISGNHIRVQPTWKRNADVSRLAGKPIKLRFVMRDAKLYSFQFVE